MKLYILLFAIDLFVTCQCIMGAEPIVTNVEVIQGLIMESDARDEVDLAPKQLAELRNIFDGANARILLRDAFRKVRRENPEMDSQSAARKAQALIDDEFYQLFKSCLTDGQLQMAKQKLIEKRYPVPTAIFRDTTILRRLDIRVVPELSQKIDLLENKLSERILQVRRNSFKEVVRQLPESSRQPLVDYAGNDWYPHLNPREAEIASIPFSDYVRSSGAVSALLLSEELAKHIELSAMQSDKLIAARSLESIAYAAASSGAQSVTEIRQSVEAASKRTQQEMEAVLSTKQRLLLFRRLAKVELENDASSVLSRREVCDYLGLNREQQIGTLVAVDQEKQKCLLEINKLKDEVLRELSISLDEKARTELMSMFGTVWSPPK